MVAIDVDDARLVLPDTLEPKALRGKVRELARERGIPSWRLFLFECSGTPAGQATAFGLLDAILMAQLLARRLGLAVGISSGANVLGAMQLVEELGHAAAVVTVLPDSNKKYLSTDLCRQEPVREEYLTPQVELEGFDAARWPAHRGGGPAERARRDQRFGARRGEDRVRPSRNTDGRDAPRRTASWIRYGLRPEARRGAQVSAAADQGSDKARSGGHRLRCQRCSARCSCSRSSATLPRW